MKVPEGRPTIARRFNGGSRSLKPIDPAGTKDNTASSAPFLSPLRGFLVLYSLPRLKPWAIFFRPAGT